MKTITVPPTPEGLAEAEMWLKGYFQTFVPKACKNLVAMMCQEGETYAINAVGHIDTGETLSSIHGYRNGDKGVIVAGGAAIWIEFGTGVAYNGSGYNHPKAQELGMAAHGTFGKGRGASFNGWYYPDPSGTHTFTDENGVTQTYSHTMGIPANRFMYNTAQMLRRECGVMATEVFADEPY